ncbi:MAG: nucleotidyltransferase family protein [Nitrososphaeria archaeon]
MSTKNNYSLIVLAAGESTRFGENKLLFKIDGRSIIRRVVEECSLEGLEIVVVTGHEKEKIMEELKGTDVVFVYNPKYHEGGMSSSIKAGVAYASPLKAYLITPGDMPYLSGWICRRIIEEHERTGSRIIVPTFEGRGGHPILVDVSLREELLGINEESRGLKGFLSQHEKEIHRVELGTSRILIDIDYREDVVNRKPIDKP